MNHEISYAVRGSRLGLLILFVCLLLIGSAVPVSAAQYSFSVPLPHKEKYMSNPSGDEDPHDEVKSIEPGRPIIAYLHLGLRIQFARYSRIFLSRYYSERARTEQIPQDTTPNEFGPANGSIGSN